VVNVGRIVRLERGSHKVGDGPVGLQVNGRVEGRQFIGHGHLLHSLT
jgi:hypothetical protein